MTDETRSFNQSEVKTYERCPKQWEYKYDQLLVPKRKARPLYFGSWVHRAIESHYALGDWKIGHQEYVDNWNKLFEEERIALRRPRMRNGVLYPTTPPLPEMVERIMRSYVWYYRNEGWTPILIEKTFEVDTPLVINGVRVTYKGTIDLVIEAEDGIWLVDHKTTTTIPEPLAFHAMDPQLMLYPWAAKKAFGLEITGIIYNYVKSKAPSIPQLTRTGQFSRRRIVTDYPTLRRFLTENGADLADFQDQLRPLRRRSPFLRRYKLPRERVVTESIVKDALAVVRRIESDKRRVRVITRDCQRMCQFHDLCRAELNGMDTEMMRQTMFTVGEEEDGLGRGDYTDPDEGEADEED